MLLKLSTIDVPHIASLSTLFKPPSAIKGVELMESV
jgi:hypothetical protein